MSCPLSLESLSLDHFSPEIHIKGLRTSTWQGSESKLCLNVTPELRKERDETRSLRCRYSFVRPPAKSGKVTGKRLSPVDSLMYERINMCHTPTSRQQGRNDLTFYSSYSMRKLSVVIVSLRSIHLNRLYPFCLRVRTNSHVLPSSHS